MPSGGEGKGRTHNECREERGWGRTHNECRLGERGRERTHNECRLGERGRGELTISAVWWRGEGENSQ